MKKVVKIASILIFFCALFLIVFFREYIFIHNNLSRSVFGEEVMKETSEHIDLFSELEMERQERKHDYIGGLNNRPLYAKEVFLTFDDGPSTNNTLKILEILSKNDIKATFFVVGERVQSNPEILRLLNNSGMCILPHSQSHDYRIYRSLLSYMEDLNECTKAIETVIHREPMHFIRFPGGSDNLVSKREEMKLIRNEVKNKGISYIDWNVSSADAVAETVPMDKIKSNVINQCRLKKLSVVLMHDSYSKTTTVEALPYIIKYLKDNGYVFRTFEDLTPTEEKEMIREGVINR